MYIVLSFTSINNTFCANLPFHRSNSNRTNLNFYIYGYRISYRMHAGVSEKMKKLLPVFIVPPHGYVRGVRIEGCGYPS